MVRKLLRYFKNQGKILGAVNEINERAKNDLIDPKINLGQIQSYLNNQRSSISSLADVEFKVFSQWGDDGIIQYLINKIDIPNKVFIEFGVENYRESNTRFLMINNKWTGLVIDGSKKNIEYIKKDIISWAYALHTMNAFITKENINDLIGAFLGEEFSPEIGLLSIDIDGNDFWVWKEIRVISPLIVIVEYNAAFGKQKAWTIPYKADFYRLNEDKTLQYWGASLKAFCVLAEEKGYGFIGCNSNGNNAYFVRKDKMRNFKSLTSEEGFVDSTFREYADENGNRVGGNKKLELIRGRQIFNVETNTFETI